MPPPHSGAGIPQRHQVVALHRHLTLKRSEFSNQAADAAAIAKRLTMEIYRMLRGEAAQTATGFGRSLSYPASGVA